MMQWKSNLVCFLITLSPLGSLSFTQSYDVSLEHVEFNKVVDSFIDGSQIHLIGSHRLLNGSVEIFQNIDDENFILEFEVLSDPNSVGEFRKLPYTIPKMPPCEALRKYRSYVKPTLEPGVNTNFPVDLEACPILKDVYYFKDINIRPDNLPPHMPRGLMKGILRISKAEEVLVEFEMLFRLDDKF